MKIAISKRRGILISLSVLFCSTMLLGVAAAQIPVTDDAFTSSAAPNANHGISLGLVVQSPTAGGIMPDPWESGGYTANTYLKFDLSALPPGVTASSPPTKANLRLYVDFVVSPGTFDVYLAAAPWTEGTLTANNAPGHVGPPLNSNPISVTSALKYVDIDITSAFANGLPTNGLVLVPSAGSKIFASFDSKENPLTSHDPELSVSVNDASSVQLQQEITRATHAENTISTNLANEVIRAEGAEAAATASANAYTNTAIMNEAAARIAGDNALAQTIGSLFTGNVSVGGTLSGATISSGNGGFQFGNTEVLSILPGLFNLWVGQDAGRGSGANNTGSNNTASGFHALFSNTTGSFNTANGAVALYSNTTGGSNVAVGVSALTTNTTGNDDTAVGNAALSSNTIGVVNTATGNNALVSNTTGSANTAAGDGALYGNTTGSGNTSMGRLSLAGLGAGANNNTGVGVNAGDATNNQPTTGSSNTYVGYQSNSGDQLDLNNATAIGANAQVTASNALVLGSINGVNGAAASTNVGIGTTAPTNIFTIGQGAGLAIADGWDTYSSRRWKTNIVELHGALDRVQQLRGVSYDLKASGKHEIGVIAEEVGKVLPEVVSYEANGQDARGVDYSRLTAVLIEAVKEQQRQIRQQQTQIRVQQRHIRKQQAQLQGQQTQLARLNGKVDLLEATLRDQAGQSTAKLRSSAAADGVQCERTESVNQKGN